MNGRFGAMVSGLRTQWAASATLRLGLSAVAALLWLYALLLASERIEARRGELAQLQAQIERSRPLGREKFWPARADEARKQLDALQAMTWPESDPGLAEAALQDNLRQIAAKAGLPLRELSLARIEARGREAGAVRAEGRPGPELPGVRARLGFEFRRTPTLALLSELAQGERAVVVDRFAFRTWTQPATGEIDLRAVMRPAREAAR